MFVSGKGGIFAWYMTISHERRNHTMTRAEYEARKRWDTSLMTEEEKEARIARIRSHCGKIDDETFTVHDDPIPAITEGF